MSTCPSGTRERQRTQKTDMHLSSLLYMMYRFLTTSTTTGHSGFQYLSVTAISVPGTTTATATAATATTTATTTAHGGRGGGIGSDAQEGRGGTVVDGCKMNRDFNSTVGWDGAVHWFDRERFVAMLKGRVADEKMSVKRTLVGEVNDFFRTTTNRGQWKFQSPSFDGHVCVVSQH